MSTTQERIERGQDLNIAWSLVAAQAGRQAMSNETIEALFHRYFNLVSTINEGQRHDD